jgi:hypothetical protein
LLMSRRILCLTTLLLFVPASSVSFGAVTMSFSASAPATGPDDQFDFTDDATVPGGTTPGGGTYNSQAFSDNGGPPGQIFTTPAGAPSYIVNSVSLKGANTGGGNSGGGVFTTATWGLRISSVSGTTLTPINTVTGIPTVAGATGIEWYAWSFTGADALSLNPSTQYSFEVYSTEGYLGFDADTSDGYAGGTAFNSAGPARSFADATTGNLANHGYDRTFHVDLQAVPEPATCVVAIVGLIGLQVVRRRR